MIKSWSNTQFDQYLKTAEHYIRHLDSMSTILKWKQIRSINSYCHTVLSRFKVLIQHVHCPVRRNGSNIAAETPLPPTCQTIQNIELNQRHSLRLMQWSIDDDCTLSKLCHQHVKYLDTVTCLQVGILDPGARLLLASCQADLLQDTFRNLSHSIELRKGNICLKRQLIKRKADIKSWHGNGSEIYE